VGFNWLAYHRQHFIVTVEKPVCSRKRILIVECCTVLMQIFAVSARDIYGITAFI